MAYGDKPVVCTHRVQLATTTAIKPAHLQSVKAHWNVRSEKSNLAHCN